MTETAIEFTLKRLRDQYLAKHLDLEIDSTLEAYEISKKLAELQSGRILAYKLGATTPLTQEIFDTKEVYYGPLLETEVFNSQELNGQCVTSLPQFKGEAEIALRLSRDSPKFEEATSTDLFDAWCCALECPWSVFSNLPGAGLNALIADRCASGALFLGKPKPMMNLPLDAAISIEADGKSIANGSVLKSLIMTVEEAALEAIKKILQHGNILKKGQWISTGGLTPCVDLEHNKEITVSFDGIKEVKVPSGTVRK